MPNVEINGESIYFEDSGGSGPVVVFSHGFLLDHEMFEPQVRALGDRYRCVTWDERCHGASTTSKPFTYWDSADDLIALLDHLGVARANLCGMSQGGFLSLRAALAAPSRVASLMLIDSQAGLENPDLLPAYDAMHADWLAHGPVNVKHAVAASILGLGLDAEPWQAKWEAIPEQSNVNGYRCLVGRDDLSARLGEIRQPALVIHGTDDAAIPLERAEQLRDGLPGCVGMVVVEGGVHASNLSHPDEVNAALAEFLGLHAG